MIRRVIVAGMVAGVAMPAWLRATGSQHPGTADGHTVYAVNDVSTKAREP